MLFPAAISAVIIIVMLYIENISNPKSACN
jgi:hypothetical protein